MGVFRRTFEQEVSDQFDRLPELGSFAWSVVEFERDSVEVLGAVFAHLSPLGKYWRKGPSQEPVGVFVDASLPGRMRAAAVDLDAGVHLDGLPVLRIDALVPGK